MSTTHDVILLGAGTAGLSALREVRKHTDDFLMVNAGPLGTTCARVGCMPSKVLIEAANAYHARGCLEAFGVRGAEALQVDIPAVLARVRKLRDYYVAGVLEGTAGLGERLVSGHARLNGPGCVEVDGQAHRAKKIIIATGSRPVLPDPWKAPGERIITTDSLFERENLPRRRQARGRQPRPQRPGQLPAAGHRGAGLILSPASRVVVLAESVEQGIAMGRCRSFTMVATAALLASPLSLAAATADRQQAAQCVVRYLQVGHVPQAAGYFADGASLKHRDRAWQVIRNRELANPLGDFAGELNQFVQGQRQHMVFGKAGANVTLTFPESVKDDLASGDKDRIASATTALAECDQALGFTPVTRLKPDTTVAGGGSSHFQCAVAYYVYSAFNPLEKENLLQRVRFAGSLHLRETPGQTQAGFQEQLTREAQIRGGRIQEEQRMLAELSQQHAAEGRGDDPAMTERLRRRAIESASLRRDLEACERQYRAAPAAG